MTLQEAKEHTIIDFADDDALVERLIMAATDHLDGYGGILGRCIISQEWRQDYTGWASCLRLPFPNVSAAAVEYTDEGGNPQTVPPSEFEVIEDARGARLQFADGFTQTAHDGRVSVVFTAGYGTAADVPADIKAAICMLVAHWYDERHAASDKTMRPVPFAVDALLAKHRWVIP
ncbi:head-tail connector protein [Roseovarius sp. SCSIO 43702]|nr:head-tail connector protein [Roseovarius sp. SCSIO 43702]